MKVLAKNKKLNIGMIRCMVDKILLDGAASMETPQEKMLSLHALKRSKGNQNIAAQCLGITRQALGKRLQKLNENSPAIEGN